MQINDLDDELSIDASYREAIMEMDKINPTDVEGHFYSLQEAYENRFITRDELLLIANHVNANTSINLNNMRPKILNAVKNLYSKIRHSDISNVKIKYYGQFDHCVAINLALVGDGGAQVESKFFIDNVLFVYPYSGAEIMIWKY